MTSTREGSRMGAADVYYNFINIGKKGTEDKNKIPQSTLEPPPSLPTEEVSTTPTTPSRSALEVYHDSFKQPEIPQETFDDIAYTEPEAPPVEKADFKPSLMWPAHPTTPSEMDREEYDVTKAPILSDKFKKDFMGTLQRFWRAAQRPDEILAGTAEFVSALPGFGAAVLSAIGTIPLEIGDRIIKDKSFNILDLYNASSKSFDKIMGDWHEYVSGPIGQVIMGPRRAGEYLGKGMTEILGGEYTKPDEGYDPGLVGEIAMAPFTAVHEPLQKLSDHPVLDDLPNIKGLFKFTIDIAALLVAHRVYKGGKDKLTADVNEEAVRIKKLADLVDEIEKLKEQGADENVIRASQEVAKIQKTQAKLRDEEIAKNMQYDQIIKEDLTSKTKRIKKVKQPKKDILDEQIDKAMQKLPDEVKPITEEIKTVEKPELGETVEEKKSKKVSKPTEVSKPEVKPKKEPITVYHGSGMALRGGKIEEGTSFSPDKSVAESYAKDRGEIEGNTPTLYESKIAFNKPKIIRNEDKVDFDWFEKAKEEGHDGVIITENGQPVEYVVIDPKAVKKTKTVIQVDPPSDLDLRTGTRQPIELSTEKSPFRQEPERTAFMNKWFSENKWDNSVEMIASKLINDINSWLDGKDVDITKVRDGLSDFSVMLDNPTYESLLLDTFYSDPVRVNNFKDMVSEAAIWARKADRSKIKRSEPTQLNMMIPLDQAPKAVIDLIKEAGILFKDILRNKEIFDKTGFWFNRHDRKWMYELDDSKVRFKASATAIDALKAGQTVGLQKVIDYPELFEAVPKLKETLVRVRPDIGGAYHGKSNIISLKSMEDILAPLEGRKSLLHEINHAVRDAAGLKEVGSSTAIALADRVDKIFSELIVRAKTPEIARELDKIWKQTEDSVFNGKGPIAISNEIVTEVSNVLRIDISKAHTAVRKFLDSGHILKDYKTNVGEVESRLVQRRANMTAEERRAKYPWEDMDEMMAEERLKARPDQKLYDIIGATIEGAEQLLKLAKEVPKYTKSAKGMKKFKPKEAAEMLREEFTRTFIDRSGNIRRELIDTLGEDGYKIVQQSALSAGSNSWSSSLLQQMYKEIDSGLTRREKSIRDDLLLCMRIKDIANYKTEKQFHYPEGLRPEIATAYIEMFGTLEKLNAEQIALIKQSASSYIEWMKKPLRDLLEHGLITEEEFKQLEAHDYRRLRKVEDIFDRKHKTKVGKKSRSIYDSGVQHLQRGHKTDILEPNSSIMALEVFNRTYGRIFNNEANKALLELARRDPENPFAREKKPVGWSTIYVYEEGVRKPIYISPELAKEWAMRDAEISYKAAKILRYASMSPVLRTFATGVNWAFAMANLPRDVMHAWYASRIYEDGKWKSVYSPHMPIAAIQMSWDLGSTFTDALLRKGRYIDYLEEGGGMEFLVHQGRVFRKGRHIEGPLDKIENFLGYFGETTEVMTRLSIRDRVIKKRASEQGLTLEEARKNPEITREATFAARDYMDFAQGGKFTKAADNAIPYLNATVVATRGMFRSFKPGSGTALANTYKLAQFAGAVTALYIASQKLASETHDALKGNPATKSNLCIPLGDGFGFEDEHGQKRYIYFKVPLDPSQKFFKTFFEACADKWRGQEVDVDRVTDTLTEMAPVDISSLPPSVSALLGYATNKDFWRNEDIWRGTDKAAKYQLPKIITGKSVGGSEEEYGTRTPEMYKDIGKYTGLSPERIEYAIGEIITNDNMWADLLGRGYEAAFKDVPESKREMHLAEVLAKLPVIKRFIGITNPSHRYGEVIDEKRSAYEIGRFVQNRGLDLRMEGYLFDKNVEKKEVVDYMKSFKDLDTFNRLKERYIFQVKTKELPNFVFWRRLQGLAPEPRAEVFAKRWDEATPQQRSQMKKEIQTVIDAGGVITDDFRSELTKIRLQSLKDVTEK